METLSRDTRPEAEAVQIALLREASPARRFSLACYLTQMAIFWSRRAIRLADPGVSEREVGLRFVALHYGEKLAAKVRRYLDERDGVTPP